MGDEGERELGEEERTGRSFAVYVQANDQQNKVFINRTKSLNANYLREMT